MNHKSLQESLSAVMDNEADELELRRILSASETDPQVRETWSRYQIARAAMRRELVLPGIDVSAAVARALAEDQQPEAIKAKPRWQGLGRIAVAASVTVAVLAGVRFYNSDDMSAVPVAQNGGETLIQSRPHAMMQSPAMLAGYQTGAQDEEAPNVVLTSSGWHEQRLPDYLRQHAQQAAANAAEGVLPYARAASLEER